MYKIEKVEMTKNGSGRPCKYPFAEMEIGDSFLGDTRAFNAACGYGVYNNKKFSRRKQQDGSIRIYRTA